MSVVFILKYILGQSIFESGGSKDRKNGALNVVDVYIFSEFEKNRVITLISKRDIYYISNSIWCCRFCRKNIYSLPFVYV